MSQMFNMKLEDVEGEVADLINEKAIHAKIDSHSKVSLFYS